MTKEIIGKEEAVKKIKELLDQIDSLYSEIRYLSEEYKVLISYYGPAGYGDGGYCQYGEWLASSQSC